MGRQLEILVIEDPGVFDIHHGEARTVPAGDGHDVQRPDSGTRVAIALLRREVGGRRRNVGGRGRGPWHRLRQLHERQRVQVVAESGRIGSHPAGVS